MITFIGILLGMFGISIMQLILATAMPFIVSEIGGDYLYSWVFSSYMLASLLTIPIFSKLADLYGKKKFYLLGMGLFAAGTLYGGLAPTMEHLIVARVIQGLGAGIMGPVSLALITEIFPPEKRGHMIGAFSFVQLFANLLSPVLGSWITHQMGWHWIFHITLGLVLIAIVLVFLDRRASQSSLSVRWTKIDLLGGLVFGAFSVLVVSFSDSISNPGELGTAGLLLLAVLASGLILVWNEARHADPIIKVAFFRTRVLRQSILSSMIAGAIMYGLVTLLPLCSIILQQDGYAIDESRPLMVFILGSTIGLLLASRLKTKLVTTQPGGKYPNFRSLRVRSTRKLLKFGVLSPLSELLRKLNTAFPKLLWGVSVIGAGVLYYAVSVSHMVLFYGMIGLLGLGLGGIMATLLINSQNAVGSADRTVLSGIVQLGRYLGAAIGVTILTGMLPEVSQISGAAQFLGAFGLLAVMYVMGMVNEWV